MRELENKERLALAEKRRAERLPSRTNLERLCDYHNLEVVAVFLAIAKAKQRNEMAQRHGYSAVFLYNCDQKQRDQDIRVEAIINSSPLDLRDTYMSLVSWINSYFAICNEIANVQLIPRDHQWMLEKTQRRCLNAGIASSDFSITNSSHWQTMADCYRRFPGRVIAQFKASRKTSTSLSGKRAFPTFGTLYCYTYMAEGTTPRHLRTIFR